MGDWFCSHNPSFSSSIAGSWSGCVMSSSSTGQTLGQSKQDPKEISFTVLKPT